MESIALEKPVYSSSTVLIWQKHVAATLLQKFRIKRRIPQEIHQNIGVYCIIECAGHPTPGNFFQMTYTCSEF
jgi:hypothetical protein